jgi:transposase-like protein
MQEPEVPARSRPNTTPEERAEYVRLYEQTGKSVSEFRRSVGIAESTFAVWRRQVREATEEVTFTEVSPAIVQAAIGPFDRYNRTENLVATRRSCCRAGERLLEQKENQRRIETAALRADVDQLTRRSYGPKSEKVNSNQSGLAFDAAFADTQIAVQEPPIHVARPDFSCLYSATSCFTIPIWCSQPRDAS